MDEKILQILMELKEGQTRIETKVDNIAKDLESVKEQTAELLEFRTETNETLAKLSENIDYLTLKEMQAEKEMFSIKRRLEIIK